MMDEWTITRSLRPLLNKRCGITIWTLSSDASPTPADLKRIWEEVKK